MSNSPNGMMYGGVDGKPTGSTNGLQVTGFLISLLSGFSWGNFFLYLSIAGLVLAAIGRAKAKREGGKTGLGTAGVVIGIFSLVCHTIYMTILIYNAMY